MRTKDIEKTVNENRTEAYKKEVLARIGKFLNYATQEYGCEFPKKFDQKLYEVAYEKQVPDKKVIDALVKVWKIWEPYVSEDSFQYFMQTGIKAIFKNHATAISHSPEMKAYIGYKAKVVKPLPSPLSIAITFKGEILRNGVPIPVR